VKKDSYATLDDVLKEKMADAVRHTACSGDGVCAAAFHLRTP